MGFNTLKTVASTPMGKLANWRNGSPIAFVPTTTDPLFANVALLLPFDVDYANSAATPLVVGPTSMSISSTTKQWGTGSAQFDGTNSFISLPGAVALNVGAGSFSIELWYNQDVGSDTVVRNLFTQPGSSANGLSISNTRRLIFWRDGIGNLILGTPPQLAEGVFHYIGIIRSGGIITIWVNNAVYATFGDPNFYDFSGWLIGSNQFNSKFKGFIDDFRVTTVARTITAAPVAAFPNS